ncbi:hypothetical protein ACFQY7_38540 [Actinomadura luteofluorescens]|uniref:hypothetical protein n=1 Tax=Actinomadura luteofluorescens TaxID=46163 RepID=UPI003642973D
MDLCARVKAMPGDIERLAGRLDSLDELIIRARVARDQADEELSAVSAKLESVGEEDIAELESKRRKLVHEKKQWDEQIGVHRKEISASEETIATARRLSKKRLQITRRRLSRSGALMWSRRC